MRSTLLALSLSLVCLCVAGPSWAKKQKAAATAAKGDHQVEQTLSWEQKVMGDDSTKKAEMDKINAARVAQEKARNAPPPAPKAKDPNKEGVHAKGEASIDLDIPSEEPTKTVKAPGVKKAKPVASSSNDELGQLVAASLHEEKAADTAKPGKGKSGAKASKTTASAKSQDPLSSMDQMLANDGH